MSDGGHSKFKLEIRKECLLDPLPKIEFGDIIGNESAKKQMRDLIKIIYGNKYRSGEEGINGLILYGPPGTGKTLFAKACANEMHVPFLNVRTTNLLTPYEDDNKKRMQSLFELAKELAAENEGICMIFMDEIESIGRNYDDDTFINQMRSYLQGEIDQCGPEVYLLGATNYINDIDSNFMKNFQNTIQVDIPLTKKEKVNFLKVKLSRSDNDINFDLLNNLYYKTAPIGQNKDKKYKSGDIADLWVNQSSILNITTATSFYQQAGIDDEMIIQPDMCVVEYDKDMYTVPPDKFNIKIIDAPWASRYFMPKRLTLLDLFKTDISGLGASVSEKERQKKKN